MKYLYRQLKNKSFEVLLEIYCGLGRKLYQHYAICNDEKLANFICHALNHVIRCKKTNKRVRKKGNNE